MCYGLTRVQRVCTIIDALVERGYLSRLPGRNRSLAVLRPIPMPEEPAIEITLAGCSRIAL